MDHHHEIATYWYEASDKPQVGELGETSRVFDSAQQADLWAKLSKCTAVFVYQAKDAAAIHPDKDNRVTTFAFDLTDRAEPA